MPISSFRRVGALALVVCSAISLIVGCAGARGLRNEQKGPNGILVRGAAGVPYYRPSTVFPAGVTTYAVKDVPKTYDVLVDLSADGASMQQSANGGGDLNGVTLGDGSRQANAGGVQANAQYTQVQQQAIADNPYAMYGAANAQRFMRANANRYEKHPLVAKVDGEAQASLSFVHEVVEIGQPLEDVQLEPFGKVLAVTTENGEVKSETREPVYTVTVPSKHRLLAIVTDAKSGAELKRAVYATWTKNLKYYQDKDKKPFATPEAAAGSYAAEKDLFAEQTRTGPLFTSRKPKELKELKELAVENLTIMPSEDMCGSYILGAGSTWLALPPSGDASAPAFDKLGTWLDIGDLGASLKADWQRDPQWIDDAGAVLTAIRDDANATPVARAVASLDLATLAACKLDPDAAKAQVEQATGYQADILGQAGFVTKGGLLDYGSDYYIARESWLKIDANVRAVTSWREAGTRRAVIVAPR